MLLYEITSNKIICCNCSLQRKYYAKTVLAVCFISYKRCFHHVSSLQLFLQLKYSFFLNSKCRFLAIKFNLNIFLSSFHLNMQVESSAKKTSFMFLSCFPFYLFLCFKKRTRTGFTHSINILIKPNKNWSWTVDTFSRGDRLVSRQSVSLFRPAVFAFSL